MNISFNRFYLRLVLAFVSMAFAQKMVHADPIATARARYATINRELKSYRRTTRELEGFSTEGGKLTAYYAGKAPRKLVALFYGESGQATNEYYFWNGQLVFFYRVDSRYGDIIGTSSKLSGKIVSREETRAYFEGGKLVRLVEGKTQKSLTAKATRDFQKETLEDVRTFLGMAQGAKAR